MSEKEKTFHIPLEEILGQNAPNQIIENQHSLIKKQ